MAAIVPDINDDLSLVDSRPVDSPQNDVELLKNIEHRHLDELLPTSLPALYTLDTGSAIEGAIREVEEVPAECLFHHTLDTPAAETERNVVIHLRLLVHNEQ